MKLIKMLKRNYILVLILILATILRFYHLDFQSAWMDEIYTLNVSNPESSFSTLINEVNTREGFPYIYFILMKILLSIFNYSVFTIRMFSAVMGILSILLFYKLSKLIFNKNVGLIAAILMTFNEYCIYISQDGRPYTLYLLSIIASFYFLVNFIKNPNKKNAIIYGCFAGLLLNTNFFGIINLFSQTIIISYYIFISPRDNRLDYIKNALLSGFLAIVIFAPNIIILLKLMDFKSGWIPEPTNESFKIIFNEFLGNSEITLFIFTSLYTYFLINLLKQKSTKTIQETIDNPSVFSFTILFPWISVFIFVLFIKSYTDSSLMISRYFVSIVPVFLIIIAISIESILNRFIKFSILITLLLFTWTNLDIVKKYYDIPNKTQFREASNFVIENNKNNEIVYTSLKYWFNFYLNNNGVAFNLIEEPSLETLLKKMELDQNKLKPFWYIDAHGRPFVLSESAQKFLNANFYVENNFDGNDAWGRHYILLKDMSTKIDLTKFKDLKEKNGDSFNYNLEFFENKNNLLTLTGWAFFDFQDSNMTKINIVLIKGNSGIKTNTTKVDRPDTTTYFKSKFNLNNAGFSSTYDISNLEKGKYQIGIYLTNEVTKKEGLILTDKFVEKP